MAQEQSSNYTFRFREIKSHSYISKILNQNAFSLKGKCMELSEYNKGSKKKLSKDFQNKKARKY